MSLKNQIPKPIRLQYRLLKRWISDYKSGQISRFARVSPFIFPSNFHLTEVQPIKPTHLFENKIHNLKIASERLSKVTVYPEQIFSFWKIIGPPTPENGFKIGRNLINGMLKEDYGGGLCQISGAIYHLVLKAGLPLLERHAHSMDIYTESERYAPLGADATVAYAYKDLRFVNTFSFPIRFSFEVKASEFITKIESPEAFPKAQLAFFYTYVNQSVIVETVQNSRSLGVSTYLLLHP